MNFTKNISRFCLIITVMILTACAGSVKDSVVVDDSAVVKGEHIQVEMKNRFERALTYQNSGKHDEAIVIYKSLLSEDDTLISPVFNLGVIAVQQTKLIKAKEYFEIVVAQNPDHKRSLNYLGYIARDSGTFDEAETYYRRVLEIDSNDELAVRNLAILLDLYRGRFEEALVLYEKYQSLQAEPDSRVKDWIFDTKSRLKAK